MAAELVEARLFWPMTLIADVNYITL